MFYVTLTVLSSFTAYWVSGDLSPFPQIVQLTDSCHLRIHARSRGRWACPFATDCPSFWHTQQSNRQRCRPGLKFWLLVLPLFVHSGSASRKYIDVFNFMSSGLTCYRRSAVRTVNYGDCERVRPGKVCIRIVTQVKLMWCNLHSDQIVGGKTIYRQK